MNNKQKRPPPSKLEAGSDIVLKWMVEKGMPLTKGVYLELAYMGDPPPDELPDDIQDALAKLPD